MRIDDAGSLTSQVRGAGSVMIVTEENVAPLYLDRVRESYMPITFRAAFKPTPSISIEQNSISYKDGADAKLAVKGRHDPCVALRAVPVVEAAAALVILDLMQEDRGRKWI